MPRTRPRSRVWQRHLEVACTFWLLCLVLVAAEAAAGSHVVIATLFAASIPMLVGWLIWIGRDLVAGLRRGMLAVVALGVWVLASSTAIIFVGLLAASKLKLLLIGI